MRTTLYPNGSARRGGALAYVLMVLTAVASLSAGLLMFSAHTTRRNTKAVADKRAFYLAEAGINEAYYGLRTGKSGQVGAMDRPARVEGGLVWVDASETPSGDVRLQSTALWGIGRASVEMVVERREEPLGIFSEGDIQLEVPLLVDGYDSQEALYEQQALVKFEPDPTTTDPIKVSSGISGGYLLYPDGTIAYEDGTTATTDSTNTAGGTTTTDDPNEANEANEATTTVSAFDGPHTAAGGQLASNGSIYLGTQTGTRIEIYGDLVPGPDGEVVLGSQSSVTGSTLPRTEVVELPPVAMPPLQLLPGVRHSSATPLIVPPSTVGYEYLDIDPGCLLVVQGPATLVVGSLRLRPQAELALENADGAVRLFAQDEVRLEAGSFLTVSTENPPWLSLQVAGPQATVKLEATGRFHGLIYAPGSLVSVGTPFEVYGSLVAGSLDLASNVRLHYDGGVFGDADALALPKLVSWRVTEIPAAVRSSRSDPELLLGLDLETLPTLAEAHETNSYTIEVTYLDSENVKHTYSGPFEAWDDYSSMWSWSNWKIYPPDAPLEQDWQISIQYKTWNGGSDTYSGPLASFDNTSVAYIYGMTFTPPGGTAQSADQGDQQTGGKTGGK